MARGNVYEIATDKDVLYSMSEVDFYDKCGEIADFFSNADLSQRNDFLEMLRGYGAETGTEESDFTDISECPYFILTKETKENYFKSRFLAVKNLIRKMTLSDFACDTTSVYSLKSMIEDDYDDAVLINSSFYNVDYFMRQAEVGVKYYVGNVVLMH